MGMKPKLSKRAEILFERLKMGYFYPAFDSKTPAAMKELEDAGLILTAGRVETVRVCYVPRKGFRPLLRESWRP